MLRAIEQIQVDQFLVGEACLICEFLKVVYNFGAEIEQKSTSESNRIGGAAADFASPSFGEHEYRPAPSFRCHVAIAIGVEATQ
jgi:hypothetical protein